MWRASQGLSNNHPDLWVYGRKLYLFEGPPVDPQAKEDDDQKIFESDESEDDDAPKDVQSLKSDSEEEEHNSEEVDINDCLEIHNLTEETKFLL